MENRSSVIYPCLVTGSDKGKEPDRKIIEVERVCGVGGWRRETGPPEPNKRGS